jgi:hypothetical protein
VTLGLVVLAALAAGAYVLRRERHGALPTPPWGAPQGTAIAWALACALVALANWPFVRAMPDLALRGLLVSDQYTHAKIAHAIATGHTPHAWIDVYNGGFPLGPHYPSVGWFLLATLMKLGVSPATATTSVGAIAIAATPALVVFGAWRYGASPAAGALAAILVSTVAPYTSFEGGWGAFFVLGVLSQVLVMPVVILWVLALLDARASRFAPALAALAVAVHPQVLVAAAVLVAVLATIALERRVRGAIVRSALAAAVLGVAIYGFGVATLHVPFGWPPMPYWKLTGFHVDRAVDWIARGDLLDLDRTPAFTFAWVAATAFLLARVERRVPRAAVVASVTAFALSIGGDAFTLMGKLGALVLSFLQPLRALALVPLVAAVTVAIAVDEVVAIVGDVAARARVASTARWSFAIAAIVATYGSMASKADEAAAARRRMSTVGSCGQSVPGFDAATLAAWARSVTHGRLAIDHPQDLDMCVPMHGVELATHAPLADSLGAGGHVGVHVVAFQTVRPLEAGSAARAESLGIRAMIHRSARRPGSEHEWRTIATRGDLEMSERIDGTDLVGVGCVRERWTGGDAELRAALIGDLLARARTIADPHALTALETTRGPVVAADVRDACSADGAVVREAPREPGVFEAAIDAPSAVDVVIRASAFPSWHVRVDGTEVPVTLVAPGFMAVRVAPGHHVVRADFALPWWYGAGIAFALLVVVLTSIDAQTMARGLSRARGAFK